MAFFAIILKKVLKCVEIIFLQSCSLHQTSWIKNRNINNYYHQLVLPQLRWYLLLISDQKVQDNLKPERKDVIFQGYFTMAFTLLLLQRNNKHFKELFRFLFPEAANSSICWKRMNFGSLVTFDVPQHFLTSFGSY